MKTKYKSWASSKSPRKIEKRLEMLTVQRPEINFEIKTRKRPGKDKTTYSIRSIIRKGHKR